MAKEISEKQKQFVRKFVELGNKTQAYMAVYSNVKDNIVARSAAARLMKDERIKEYYNQLTEELQDEEVASVREVLKTYTSILRREMCDYSVSNKGTIEEHPAKISDVIRAGEALLKRLDEKEASKTEQQVCGVILMPEVYEDI